MQYQPKNIYLFEFENVFFIRMPFVGEENTGEKTTWIIVMDRPIKYMFHDKGTPLEGNRYKVL